MLHVCGQFHEIIGRWRQSGGSELAHCAMQQRLGIR